MENELTRHFHCTAALCDAQRELSLLSLAADLIDTATAHADALGIGNGAMSGQGWVLARLTVEMKRFPPALADYSIITWVESWNRHFSERCFEIQDGAGVTMGYARSVWMVMDLQTHANCGLQNLDIPYGLVSGRPCPIPRQSRHKPLAGAEVSEYRFEYSDIDYYRHVNTLRYIQLLLNRFSLEHLDACRISRFEIAFMHECYYGETGRIEVVRQDDEAEMAISTERAAAIRAKIRFAPREQFS